MLPTYSLDASYFETLDTQEKAYWAGFIAADGYVAEKAPWVVVLMLGYDDIQHLEQFAKDISYTGPIKLRTASNGTYKSDSLFARIELCRKKLCQDLVVHGICHDKLKRSVPSMPDELLRHFFRGYFDGDGSVYLATNSTVQSNGIRRYYKYPQVCIACPPVILRSFTQWLSDNGISFTLRASSSESVEYIRINGGRNLRKLYALFYKDATRYLERKRAILATA